VTQWWQGATLLDAEVPGVVDDFGTSLDSTGQVWAGTGNPDTSVHSAAGLNDGAWHHLVFTRAQAAGTLTLYIDGAQVATGHGGTHRLTSTPGLRIGVLQSAVHSSPGASLMPPSTTPSYPQLPWLPICTTGTEPRVRNTNGVFGLVVG
jgi:Concanavalin A-like lectin/glucanases superfamily